ncbi:hypothetical protein K469DRAFT_690920 [Zopfia rhizophila CBS 207.26]|uniref:Uncharacterized protein n=1 Tax=Zopfia rhizophila CBS 207.26 TaxID=1314779 RepID=A0A6A6DVT5_9PEZI|nr:hypothetical protein K469DRAFT_690920 [Zopfia rhizophila CBS 207.26]
MGLRSHGLPNYSTQHFSKSPPKSLPSKVSYPPTPNNTASSSIAEAEELAPNVIDAPSLNGFETTAPWTPTTFALKLGIRNHCRLYRFWRSKQPRRRSLSKSKDGIPAKLFLHPLPTPSTYREKTEVYRTFEVWTGFVPGIHTTAIFVHEEDLKKVGQLFERSPADTGMACLLSDPDGCFSYDVILMGMRFEQIHMTGKEPLKGKWIERVWERGLRLRLGMRIWVDGEESLERIIEMGYRREDIYV